jgi:hypothetical protein
VKTSHFYNGSFINPRQQISVMAKPSINKDLPTADSRRIPEPQDSPDIDHATTATATDLHLLTLLDPPPDSITMISSVQVQPVGKKFNFSKLLAELRVKTIHLTFEPQAIVVEFNNEDHADKCVVRRKLRFRSLFISTKSFDSNVCGITGS